MHGGLEPVCLNVFALQNALNIYRANYGPLRLWGIVQIVPGLRSPYKVSMLCSLFRLYGGRPREEPGKEAQDLG